MPPKKQLQSNNEVEVADEQVKEPQGYVYPQYDRWQVDVSPVKRKYAEDEPREYELTAIKLLRANIKVETHVAEQLNLQSHNNLRRLYPAGSITNGHTETITAI